MSQNFELVSDPSFERGLVIDPMKSSHVAQQIRREKLKIHHHQQLTPSVEYSSPPLFQSQQSGVAEASRAASRSGYPVLPGIGGRIYDPNDVRVARPIIIKDDVVVTDQIVHNCQPNADYILNLLQNLDTQNPVLGSITSSSYVSSYRLPIGYPPEPSSSPSFASDNRSGEEGDKGFTVFPLRSTGMQHHPVQESQSASRYQHEINQSRGALESAAFASCQSGVSYGGACSTAKGLSLSLSFHNPTHDFWGQNVVADAVSDHSLGKSRQDFAGSSHEDSCSDLKDGANALRVRETGYYPAPIALFSGYSDVLKNSKFLKPAQLLLEEMCSMGKMAISSFSGKDEEQGDRMDGCFEGSGLSVNPPLVGVSPVGSKYPSARAPAKVTGLVNGLSGCEDANERGRKKNRLIFLLEEVYQQYRHYSQQLQTVLTSFESTSGLNNAAPYASFAVKTLSKHFQNLKDAINDNLKFSGKVLGKECFSAADGMMSRSPSVLEGHGYGKSDCHLSNGPPQLQHVWRPQRGLPERAVAVLRTWLFEHFLHPYPSDMDKQMLAKQTGITRSQVSNWFINARVRLWKPLVEEIHSLETTKNSCSPTVLDLIKKQEHKMEDSDRKNIFQQQSKRSRWVSGEGVGCGDDGATGYQSSKGVGSGGVSLTLGTPSQRSLLAGISP